MTIHFNLTIDDWLAFQEYYKGRKAPLYRILMPLLGISAVLLVILNILYLMNNPASLMTTLSGIMLLSIFYLFFLKKRSTKHLRKAALDLKSKHSDAFGQREMSFDEKQITIEAGNSIKELPWEEVDRWEENKEYFFIFNAKGMVYIVPKRSIKDSVAFTEMLNQHFLHS